MRPEFEKIQAAAQRDLESPDCTLNSAIVARTVLDLCDDLNNVCGLLQQARWQINNLEAEKEERKQGGDAVTKLKIDVEKRLCGLLGKDWDVNVSIKTLCDEIDKRLPRAEQ